MYETLNGILQPLVILLLLAGGSVVWLWRRPEFTRGQRAVLTGTVVGLWVLFLPALSYLALGSLEWWFPPSLGRPANIQAIVVLGGHIDPPTATRPRAVLGWDSYTRCLQAIDVYRDGPPCPVFVTGGKVVADQPGPTIAETIAAFLVSQGIPEADIVVEARSSTTYENARETRALLDARKIRRIVLVTSATHLLRATKCFQKQGYEITTSGCNYGTYDYEWTLRSFLPSPGASGDFHRVMHEWLGIAYYRLRGRI